jgi:hypothetical protein
MSQQQPSYTGLCGYCCRLGAGAVETHSSLFGLVIKVGCFMVKQVCTMDVRNDFFIIAGVCTIGITACRLFWPYRFVVPDFGRFTCQIETETPTGNAMRHGKAGNPDLPGIQDSSRFAQGMKQQPEAIGSAGYPVHQMDDFLQFGWTENMQIVFPAGQVIGIQQSGYPKVVVAMQVGNENMVNLRPFDLVTLQLVLGGFSTVNQKLITFTGYHLGSLVPVVHRQG